MNSMLEPVYQGNLEVFDLPQFRLNEMSTLLREESAQWRHQLLWDYSSSSSLVGQFIDAHALQGAVLCRGEQPIGYSYYILEDRKALLGSLFLQEEDRNESNYWILLGAALRAIRRRDDIVRVEAQFMLHNLPESAPPLVQNLQVYERLFMWAPLGEPAADSAPVFQPKPHPFRIESWHERFQDRAAYLIEESYRHHQDALINDQYCSVEGARRFLYNIIQYPGCGAFSPNTTFVAVQPGSGRLMGCCLTSIVDRGVGHITQICTNPDARGLGLGEQLLRESLHHLRRIGCERATLTVTKGNQRAISLYEKLGFHVRSRFPAYVWDGLSPLPS